MGTLAGSQIDPGMLHDKLGQQERINDVEKRKQQEAIETELQRWRDFHDSPQGQICAELAEPKIRYYDTLLGSSVQNLVQAYGLPLDCIENLRAEWRGARGVWYQIMCESEKLKKQVEDLEKGGETEEIKKKGWLPLPKKFKKDVDSFE